MSSLFDRFKGKREPTSAEIAKERLQFVLVTDRSHLSPDKLEAMQTEILMVIKRYIDIDELDVQIKFEQRDRKNYLVADIPLHRDQGEVYQTPTNANEAKPDAPATGEEAADTEESPPKSD